MENFAQANPAKLYGLSMVDMRYFDADRKYYMMNYNFVLL